MGQALSVLVTATTIAAPSRLVWLNPILLCLRYDAVSKGLEDAYWRQRAGLWTACGQRCVDSKNRQTTPATTSTTSNAPTTGRR